MIQILVTGAKGQLGSDLKLRSSEFPGMQFDFIDLEELDLTIASEVQLFFKKHSYDYCINCAAYTAVDKAENDEEMAFKVNSLAIKNLVHSIRSQGTRLIHISTDYVFNGLAHIPYTEEDEADPQTVYGRTKLAGEKTVREYFSGLILRTSWLYSIYGHNFVKTILEKGRVQKELRVVNDQIGTPTWAGHLADAILEIIDSVERKKVPYKTGLFHFSNEGSCNWYDFALAIKEGAGLDCEIIPVPTSEYSLPAKRPAYSILNKEKIRSTYPVKIPSWQSGLSECLKRIPEIRN